MRARRTDANQDAIADEFERLGCIVHRTNADWDISCQLPELPMVALLVEIKNPATSYGRRGLNKRQQGIKIARWTISGVEGVSQAVQALKTLKRALDAF